MSALFVIVASLVFITAIVAAAVKASQERAQRSPRTMMVLSRAIHARMGELVAGGFNQLVPKECDPETAFLSIRMVGDVAVIDRIAYGNDKTLYSDVVRSYYIYPDGAVEWHVAGYLRPADHAWCDRPLTVARLEYLLLVLQEVEMYSPRFAKSRAS